MGHMIIMSALIRARSLSGAGLRQGQVQGGQTACTVEHSSVAS